MPRSEFAAMLARLVRDGTISEDEAAGLLIQYDAGEIDPAQPMPPEMGAEGITQEEIAIAVGLIIFALRRGRRMSQAADQVFLESALAGELSRRIALADWIQDDWSRQAAELARDLADGRITLAQWQERSLAGIRRNGIALEILGAGESRRIGGAIPAYLQREAAYLARFAETISLFDAQGRPLSEGQIRARLQLYGGQGRAQFFRLFEQAQQGRGQGGPGWVVEYIAVDDERTCWPCSAAQGYYLPGAGPFPGEICEGGGHCRCSRISLWAPDIYQSLV